LNPEPAALLVIDHLHPESTLPGRARDYRRDTITLGWEDRVQAHGRRRSDSGLEFALSLPRGTVLRGGDCLVLDESRVVIAVVERPEPVFVIEPGSPREWGLYAYHIGNRHQPMMLTDRSIVCPDVPGVEQLLNQQHIPYTRAVLPFTPATAVAGHQH
jgi:urease accessory protein